jgi:hypothetical protein
MPIRDLFVRDLGRRIEGVVKVYDQAALAQEIREFVLTDWTEEKLKAILDTFTESLDARRKRAQPMDDMGIWISGFFGSGKSHFAKLVGYLLENPIADAATRESAMDLFERHLGDGRFARDIRRRLAEIQLSASVKTVAFEIKAKQTLNNPSSVAEILLSTFYESLGYSDAIYLARIEKRLAARGRYPDFRDEYQRLFGQSWEEGRKEHEFNRARIATVMAHIYPEEYATETAARDGLMDAYRNEKVTADSVARELVEWVDAQPAPGTRQPHLVFVIDEMGQFVSDDRNKIEELRALVEQLGNQGKGKIWLVVTSQQALEQVCDRANLQLPLLGKLDARFCVKVGLISDEINKVVGERILKKREAKAAELALLYERHAGFLAQLADLKSTRQLGQLNGATFAASYPFLPQTVKLAQDVFEALSGFRISGGVRSMISVTQEVARKLADQDTGALASFDQVFDAIEQDLYSQEYLGASGVQAIRESAERVPEAKWPARVLKVLWMLQEERVTFVPRTPEVLAKLLVRHVEADLPELRVEVEQTLLALQAAGYVARDEAGGEYKYLNEKERTIEQEVQRLVRDMGLGPAVRQAKEILKARILTRGKLDQFQIRYGKSHALFAYDVQLDGEDLATGNEIAVSFIGPLSARKKDRAEIERENRARGNQGRRIYWIASTPEVLEGRLRRYEALRKLTEDERFTKDAAKSTQDALGEKRKERSALEESLARELERSFREGWVYLGGDEQQLDGSRDLKTALQEAGSTLVGNLYTRFSDADKRYDFRSLARILNPAERKLYEVETDLDLFDSQGMLQRERPLPATVLEAIAELEDENRPTDGVSLLAFFSKIPFGWPSEIVRLTLAAALRGGAVYLEIPSAQGARALFDYTEPGTIDLLAKVNSFKRVTFRIAQTGLSVEELKTAARLLVRIGATDVPEAGNVIAARVREAGTSLLEAAERARTYAGFGLPLPEVYEGAESLCRKAATARDPTAVVKDFLARGEEWVALARFAEDLSAFLADGRDRVFEVSRRVLDLCRSQPPPRDRPEAEEVRKGLEDAQAVVHETAILDSWTAYRDAYHRALGGYRSAYQQIYASVSEDVAGLRGALLEGEPYRDAPPGERDPLLEHYFAAGGPLHLPNVDLRTAENLLAASERHSLSALQGLAVGLSGWRSTIEAELLRLALPGSAAAPPPAAVPPAEKAYEWRPLAELGGRSFGPHQAAELEHQLDQIKERLTGKLGEGYTVVIR